MSDLYANITETVQHDPDRPGVHTTVYADLHTGDPAVMAATLRGVADSLDPGDPVEAEEWADRQADERAARDAALVAPWREAFRALSGVIPDRYASRARVEPAGPRKPVSKHPAHPLAIISGLAAQLANAGYVSDSIADLEQAMYDALADLAQLRMIAPGVTASDPDARPMYAHDADCNTVHDGPEPCPPPRCGDRPDGSRCNLPRNHRGICIPQAASGETVHRAPADGASTMPCCGRSPFEAPGDRMTLSDDLVTCQRTRDAAKPAMVDVLDLVQQYGDARWSEGTELDGGGPNWSAARSKAAEHLARIEAEVQRLRAEADAGNEGTVRLAACVDELAKQRDEAREKLAESQATAAGMRDTLNLLREALRAETITDALAAIERLRAERDEARAALAEMAPAEPLTDRLITESERLRRERNDALAEVERLREVVRKKHAEIVTVTMTKSAAEYAYSALFKRVNELGHGSIHRAGFAAAMKDVANALRIGDGKPARPKVGLTDPPTERTYTIQLNRAENEQLLTWLSTNAHGGSISIGRRLTIDVVEGGGLLVHARPYRFDDRAAEDAERSERCTQCGKLFTERACGPTHALLTTLQADAQAACLRVVEAARAWEARIKSDPNNWADDEDFALIKAVDALSEYATLRPDILYATRQAGWRDGVHWAAAETDAQAVANGGSPGDLSNFTDHLRSCADDPECPTLVSRDQAPETRP